MTLLDVVLKMPKTNWKARLGFENVDVANEYKPPEVTEITQK